VREYARLFGVTSARAATLPPNALIMHPGPMNRGVEIDSDVADLPESVIEEQVTNGIAIRMALLYLLLGGAGEEAA
jgi:aspartate carbamoyltransferase catalytic subunit